MSIGELASATRVFVSGLPPSFTSNDLRTFFGQKFHVTDAHVLPDRRIGFVGFGDHDSAECASRYFNKTFIRMSRISVQLAKPVDVKRNEYGQATPVSQRALKAQSKTLDDKPNAQKRKRDRLDDGEALRTPIRLRHETTSISSTPDQVQKSVGDSVIEGAHDSGDRGERDQWPSSRDKAISDIEKEPAPLETSAPLPAVASDTDWLRGKTSRILDLGDSTMDVRDIEDHRASSPREAGLPVPDHDQTPEDTNAKHSSQASNESERQVSNGRLFLRNLAFDATEDGLRNLFVPFGKLEEVHLVQDIRTSKCKGLAFVQFLDPSDAHKAMSTLDGKPFQGRLLHVLPASNKKSQKLSEFEISKLPLKRQEEIRRKTNASTSSFSWNSLYMNPDAVLASVADRLGVVKSDLLDPSSTDAAVKQAHAETSIIKDTKSYLRSQGINVDAFKNGGHYDRALLLKNFPFGTTRDELTTILSKYGNLERLIFPTTGTMAIALFEEAYAAQTALRTLAYANVKGSVLYLEKAPAELFEGLPEPTSTESSQNATGEVTADTNDVSSGASSTVFIRNLNFATTTARLTEVFRPLTGFLSARVKTRTDATRPGQVLSMGFGFVEFPNKRQAQAAVATMDGYRLDGHEIQVQLSNKNLDAAEERRKDDQVKKTDQVKTKIIIKNLPFEASKKDIRSLFSAYGNLRSVRMPKKFDNSARGFAFAEFVTAKEAKNAIEALSNTHLLGRRLVLDFAESDLDDPEETIKAMEKKAGRQNRLTIVSKLITGSTRRKFTADVRDDEPL